MLDHVRDEQMFAEPVQRREQREREAGPADPEAGGLPSPHAVPMTGLAPELCGPDQIERGRCIKRNDDPRIVGPCRGREGIRGTAVCGRRHLRAYYEEYGEQRGHRRHGLRINPAMPCIVITMANNTPAATPMPESRWRG